MHDDARTRVGGELVEARLLDEIGRARLLTSGASAAGARVHTLPEKPHDIEDDGNFHYAVLGPKTASESGKPSPEARRYLEETTGADRPRVYRNAVVLAVPSRDGLEVARDRVKDYLAWEEVRSQLKGQEIDPIREATLANKLEGARRAIPEAVRQAYCIVVTVSDKDEVQAFKITGSDDPLFATIKADSRARIQETAVSADALLPGGPYALWREGETARRVSDLVGAFAQFPHLPKMLSRRAIVQTLVGGCREGLFVFKLTRPDRSIRTFWQQAVDEEVLKEPGLEVVLPEAASLSEISPALLGPGRLPGLWVTDELTVKSVHDYFAGGKEVKVQREGYAEPLAIPAVDPAVLDTAIGVAVRDGQVWLTSGPASVLAEDVPAGILTPEAVLQAPPPPVPTPDLLPLKIPAAWQGESTTAMALAVSLSQASGKTLPWPVIRKAIHDAIQARFIEVAQGDWPCEFAAAQRVALRLPKAAPIPPPVIREREAGVRVAQGDLSTEQLQELSDRFGEIKKAAAGIELKLRVDIQLGGETKPAQRVVDEVNEILKEIKPDLWLL